MYKSQVKEINRDLRVTKKAIIAIGDSFVQGQGAIDDYIYQNHTWKFEQGTPAVIEMSSKDKKRLIKSNNSVTINLHTKELDFTMMEYDNAFVNVLCKKYFDGKYTPINLGIRGCGNRGTIKELYMYPNIDWDIIEEIIDFESEGGKEVVLTGVNLSAWGLSNTHDISNFSPDLTKNGVSGG